MNDRDCGRIPKNLFPVFRCPLQLHLDGTGLKIMRNVQVKPGTFNFTVSGTNVALITWIFYPVVPLSTANITVVF